MGRLTASAATAPQSTAARNLKGAIGADGAGLKSISKLCCIMNIAKSFLEDGRIASSATKLIIMLSSRSKYETADEPPHKYLLLQSVFMCLQ